MRPATVSLPLPRQGCRPSLRLAQRAALQELVPQAVHVVKKTGQSAQRRDENANYAVNSEARRAVSDGKTAAKVPMVRSEHALKPRLVERLSVQLLLKKDD